MSSPLRSGIACTEGPEPELAAIGPMRRVLVSYESSARGRSALLHALRMARRARVPLTVASVAPKEQAVGCARCRANAVMWNQEMRFLAEEDLAEAAALVGPEPAVDYVAAVGDSARALGEVAAQCAADVIVVPWESPGRLRRLFSETLAECLRKTGRWEVIVGPCATPRRGDDSEAGFPAPAAGRDCA
jgi:nucleotide-binding universal stress UspA family protein